MILVHTNDDLGYILTHAGPNEHIRLTAGTPGGRTVHWVKKTS